MERPEEFTGQVQAMARRVVEEPGSWTEVRAGVRQMFDQISSGWDQIATRDGHLTALAAALDTVPSPRVAFDIGTGTGRGAELVGQRFPGASVTGVDISEAMLREAVKRDPSLSLVLGDASQLPLTGSCADLVVSLNMFLFLGEAMRVLRPGGRLVVVYSGGDQTPVYVPDETVHSHARIAGASAVEAGKAGDGIYHVAVKG